MNDLDFNSIADILKEANEDGCSIFSVMYRLADYFNANHMTFDRKQFLEDCGWDRSLMNKADTEN